ncbi:urease accessory protein UreF [Rhodobacteraceae bacterium 2376]|uniref:Urease accessory protein UreF n=1 Tax=Rhabdonatronobacter sediminivivens TaxID=2743469 RepID=A0A7Z0KYH7_9RHOB|nr:urease accessory UreF family protein [Rhabdonatronobacter sediminivivens]NYS25220.1 urease accessory protein UreF [Rhabdonatronobacter sediminivivens]
MDSATLQLTHWLSPAFPTGAFAYSHGLEQVIAQGAVSDAASLEHWLSDVLHHGAGWQDGVLLALALEPGADLDTLDAMAQALQPSAERLQESTEQGAAFARTVARITARPLPPRALPIAVAEAARPLNPDPAQVIALYLQGFATNLVTIAIRHVPLGQGEGHAVLARLLPPITALAARAARAGMEDLGTACLGADMAAMDHETKEVRLFRT